MRNCRWKSVSACCDSLVPCLMTRNDAKLCLSTWVTLCPNMAERCRHKKCHLFYLVRLCPFGAPSSRAYAQYRLVVFL